jgi:hypothetical protein
MTEAIHIQKDVPTAHWRINPRIRQNRSQPIRTSPTLNFRLIILRQATYKPAADKTDN